MHTLESAPTHMHAHQSSIQDSPCDANTLTHCPQRRFTSWFHLIDLAQATQHLSPREQGPSEPPAVLTPPQSPRAQAGQVPTAAEASLTPRLVSMYTDNDNDGSVSQSVRSSVTFDADVQEGHRLVERSSSVVSLPEVDAEDEALVCFTRLVSWDWCHLRVAERVKMAAYKATPPVSWLFLCGVASALFQRFPPSGAWC